MVSIYGEWGIGKSKTLQDIEKLLKEDNKIIPIFFNPWKYEHETHIIIPLLNTIALYLEKL